MMKKLLEKSIDEYFEKFKNDQNTVAIVITGSYGRGENDFLSDIDWVLIVNNKKDSVSGFKEQYNKIEFDCRIEEYEFLKNADWCMDQYYAYLNCKIYYDKELKFKQTQDVQKKEWYKYIKKFVAIRLVECSVFLKFPDTIPELKVKQTHYEKFVLRNDYYSAYNCLNIIENQLIDLCYIANAIPIPDTKNKMRNIHKYSFSDLLKSCCNRSNEKSIDELNETYDNFKKILNAIIKTIKNNYNYENGIKIYYYKYRGVVI